MMPIDDTTLTLILGFLLTAGGGLWKGYQWYVLHKEALKDAKTKETLRKKNREINAAKKLNALLTKDLAACQQDVADLKAEQRQTRSSVLVGEPES